VPKSAVVKRLCPITRRAAWPVENTGVWAWPDAHTAANPANSVRAREDFMLNLGPFETNELNLKYNKRFGRA
jgi:hypothetical protein